MQARARPARRRRSREAAGDQSQGRSDGREASRQQRAQDRQTMHREHREVAVAGLPVRLFALVVVVGCNKSEPVTDCSTVANGVKRYWAERAQETRDPVELAAIGETSRVAAEKLERHCVA